MNQIQPQTQFKPIGQVVAAAMVTDIPYAMLPKPELLPSVLLDWMRRLLRD